MTILAVVGSGRMAHTHEAVEAFLECLEKSVDLEWEIIRLVDLRLEACIGCKACMDRGEELCPLDGDSASVVSKMMNADGVVFASPNYAFHISGLMKVFLDRVAYIFHRPRMFGRTFTSILAQGVYGGNRILRYFKFIGSAMGFNAVRVSCITTLEPMSEKQSARNRLILENHARRYLKRLGGPAFPRPSVLDVVMFRISRSRIHSMLDENYRDYTWYRNKGWFDSAFFYPVRLGPIARFTGWVTDFLAG